MFDRKYFVLAPSFHGATLLSKLLNAHPQIVALGDTYPSNLFNQVCGCGKRVSKCDFWETVKYKVKADRYEGEATMLPLHPRIISAKIDRFLVNNIYSLPVRSSISREARQAFIQDYESFLEAVYELSGNRNPCVFIDGEKSIPRVQAMLDASITVDGILHLTREPEHYAKSFAKQSGRHWSGLVEAGLRWRAYHRRVARLRQNAPYLHLTYEQLAIDTDTILAQVFEFLGVRPLGINQLKKNFTKIWHFMGNVSLMGFDGRMRPSVHSLTPFEGKLVRMTAGSGSRERHNGWSDEK